MRQHRGVDPLLAAAATMDFTWVGQPADSVAEARDMIKPEASPETLKALLTWLALQEDKATHDLLQGPALRKEIRAALDPETESRASFLDLRIGWILAALGSNPSEPARNSLNALSQRPFVDEVILYQQLVARAFAAQRPPSAAALTFWRQHSGPASLVTADCLLAMAVNETPPALALWSEIWRDSRLPEDFRAAWAHQILFPLRHKEPILLTIEEILPRLDSEDLQKAMVETILAEEDRWGLPDATVPENPDEPSRRAKAAKRRIGRWARKHLDM